MAVLRKRLAATAAGVALLALAATGIVGLGANQARGEAVGELRAAFAVTSRWQGGYVADYTISNTGATAVSSWQLGFELPAGASLVNSWSGSSTVDGDQVSVTNLAWNGSLAPGVSTVYGFQVSSPDAYSPPTACTVDGADCSSGVPVTTQPTTTTGVPPTSSTTTTLDPPAPRLQAVFAESSRWDGGYVAGYSITNLGTLAVSSWRLQFQLPPESSLVDSWDGSESTAGQLVTATNASWDGTIAPGSSVVFGFQVNGSGADEAPSGCLIDTSPCSSDPPTSTSSSTTSTSTSTTSSTTSTSTSTTPSTKSPGITEFAPYVDMTLQREDLAGISTASGIKDFTLAFIVSEGDCDPSWGAAIPVGSSADYVGSAIDALRRAGGDVIVSFGGEANTALADSCSSSSALEAAYQKVVDTYGVYDLDFDIEGADVGDTASIARRSAALAMLQSAEAALGHTVTVSYTLPVLPTGFPPEEMGVIRSAVAAGVRLSVVNPMTMDYGDGAAPDPAGQMGTYAIEAAEAVESQLAGVYPSATSSQIWSMIGITPMVGQNDITDEVFTVADAVQVATFASEKGIGRLAMWSVTRDQQCSQGVIDYDSPTCSGILQPAWAFAEAFERS